MIYTYHLFKEYCLIGHGESCLSLFSPVLLHLMELAESQCFPSSFGASSQVAPAAAPVSYPVKSLALGNHAPSSSLPKAAPLSLLIALLMSILSPSPFSDLAAVVNS